MASVQPSVRVIIGIALMLFSSVLLGVGIHHLIATGTCSSNGYSRYGPVPTCPPGTSAWFFFVFGGVTGNVVGSIVAGRMLLVFGTIFPAIGLGAFTLSFDKHVGSFAKTFGLLFGGGFLVFGMIAAGAMLGAALRGTRRSGPGRTSRTGRRAGTGGTARARRRAGTGRTARAGRRAGTGGTTQSPSVSTTAQSWSAPSPAPSPTPPDQSPGESYGVLDQISRLADLRTSGALTDAEFESEKAKLLSRS